MRIDFMQKMQLLCYFWLGMVLVWVVCVEAKTMPHRHRNIRSEMSLQATLTYDFGPHPNIQGKTVDVEKSVDYYFPVDHQFKFFCNVKHPSHSSKMRITKEQILPDGTKLAPFDLLNMNAEDETEVGLNPKINDQRFTVKFEEPIEAGIPYVKNTLIIKPLKLNDSGIYKCSYRKMEKQANVVVYKEAKMKDIIFPVESIQEFQIDQPANISCRVSNVYPKPVITFIDNYVKVQDSLREEIAVPRSKPYDTFTLLKTYTFAAKFTDNNKNLSCSVYSHGANATVSKSFTLNVKGLLIRSEYCKSGYVANLNEINLVITCEFFSNPRIEPIWETKKTANKAETEITSPATILANNLTPSLTDNSKNKIVDSAKEEVVKIPNNEDENSNYIGSIESVGNNGIYRATLRIKTITEDDFRNFTLKLNNGKIHLEHVIVLNKAPQVKEKEAILNANSDKVVKPDNSAKHSHSSTILSLLICQFVFFLSIFSR